MTETDRRAYDQQMFNLTAQLATNNAIVEQHRLELQSTNKRLDKLDKKIDNQCDDCDNTKFIKSLKTYVYAMLMLFSGQCVLTLFILLRKALGLAI